MSGWSGWKKYAGATRNIRSYGDWYHELLSLDDADPDNNHVHIKFLGGSGKSTSTGNPDQVVCSVKWRGVHLHKASSVRKKVFASLRKGYPDHNIVDGE